MHVESTQPKVKFKWAILPEIGDRLCAVTSAIGGVDIDNSNQTLWVKRLDKPGSPELFVHGSRLHDSIESAINQFIASTVLEIREKESNVFNFRCLLTKLQAEKSRMLDPTTSHQASSAEKADQDVGHYEI